MKVIKQSAHIIKEWPNMNLYERCEFAGRISHASEDKIKEGSAEEFVRRMVRLGHESVFEFARVMCKEVGDYPWYGANLRKLRELRKEKGYQTLQIHKFLYEVNELYPAFFEDCNELKTQSLMKNIQARVFIDTDVEKEELYFHQYQWIPVLITTNRAISHQLVRYRKNVVYLQQSQRYVKFHDDIEFIDPSIYFLDKLGEPYDNPEYEGGRFIKNHAMEVWKTTMEGAEQDYIWFLSEGYPAQAARLVLPNSTATKLIMYASPDTWRHVFEQRISDKADPMIRELLEPLKEEFVKEGLL